MPAMLSLYYHGRLMVGMLHRDHQITLKVLVVDSTNGNVLTRTKGIIIG